MRNASLLLTSLIFILVILFCADIPFFWDGPFFSEIAVNFYNNGVQKLISFDIPDTGGFPLYSVYLSFIWMMFGKTLIVSHLSMLPFILGTIYLYFNLAKRFLNPQLIPVAMLLLLCEPSFMTQSILMGYDLLMIFFFLLSLNALLSNKRLLYSIALLFLCLSSMRGIMLGISLFFIDLSFSRKLSLPMLKNYALAFTSILCWAFYHYKITGWFFFSPLRENTHEAILSFKMMLKQIGYITWKIIDFGRVTLWIFLFITAIFFYRKVRTEELNILFKILFIPLLILILLMVPFSNPIGQKYFIVIFLLLNIAVCYIFQTIKNNKLTIIMSAIFLISLVTGNFWIYPEKFGNGWDASLKVLPYFELKEKMDAYINDNGIPPEKIGTEFPLIADKKYTHLSDQSFHYTDVWSGPINNHAYFLHSNVTNTGISKQVEDVKRNWQLLKQFERGQVSIALYKNPLY